MNTSTRSDNGKLFVVLMSYVPPASSRKEGEYDVFELFEDAIEWAEAHLRADVTEFGAGWNFRADVVRADYADFDADTWDLSDTVARARWDSETNSIVWDNDGPFDLDDCNSASL